MYKKVSTDMNFVEREKQVEKFWEDNQIFEKSMKVREGNPSYVFYDGPPTANGKPHIGHVETRVIKDMIPRYRTMKGYQVPRKAGWDTHGLPVELEVEKKLGLDGKDQIEKYGVEPFIEQCKESVWKYEGMWEDFSHTVGFWADMKNPYVTYHNDYQFKQVAAGNICNVSSCLFGIASSREVDYQCVTSLHFGFLLGSRFLTGGGGRCVACFTGCRGNGRFRRTGFICGRCGVSTGSEAQRHCKAQENCSQFFHNDPSFPVLIGALIHSIHGKFPESLHGS